MNLYSLQSIPNLTPAFVISCCVQVEQGNAGMGEERRCTKSGSSPCLFIAGSLEAAYSLNWGAQKIWGKDPGETLALL